MSEITLDSSSAPSAPHFRTVALIIAAAMFMEQLDATILATALPTMARYFEVSPSHMSIALTSYLLSLAVLIPASGKVADRFGSRTVFATAIGIFIIGSFLCAQAPNLPCLVAARVLQGAGGAMMMPVGRLVLLRTVEKKNLVSAMGWVLVPALTGPILGPPIGGFIVDYVDWRWIFYINIPIGLIGLLLTRFYIPNVRETRHEPFDLTGFILSGIALSSLLFGFEMTSRGATDEILPALCLLLIGFVSGAAYIAHARRPHAYAPILDLSLMRVPTFRISVIAGSLTRITQGAQPFLLPLMMQVGFGMSAAHSGMLTFATACGSMLMKILARPVLRRFGFRTTLIWNSIFSSLLYAGCAAFRPDWPSWAIFGVLILCGFSMSLQFTAYNTVAYDDIPAERTSSANSFYTTFQQLMLSFGICAGALALTGSRLVQSHAQPELSDFSAAFLCVTCVSLLAAPVAALFNERAGEDMTGHRHHEKSYQMH